MWILSTDNEERKKGESKVDAEKESIKRFLTLKLLARFQARARSIYALRSSMFHHANE
jgi:hypothetical protein